LTCWATRVHWNDLGMLHMFSNSHLHCQPMDVELDVEVPLTVLTLSTSVCPIKQ
jgi:hypothetical protein